MSGYLEVKYPKTNLGLIPFKSWKRQWCILRPSPTSAGGSLAVYCSEAGGAAGAVSLAAGGVVRRAASRSRSHAFAIFSPDAPQKPRVLLAASSSYDAQVWMEKIRAVMHGNKNLGTEALLKDSYSVTIITTEMSVKCGLVSADCILTLSSNGLSISQTVHPDLFIDWKYICEVTYNSQNMDKSRLCVLSIDSSYLHGGGVLKLLATQASELTRIIRQTIGSRRGSGLTCQLMIKKQISKSDGDLRTKGCSEFEDGRRTSWYSGPSDISLDDIDLIMSKETKPLDGVLSRCSRASRLAACHADDDMSDRRSLLSIASGIYEEIPDPPETDTYCPMDRKPKDAFKKSVLGLELPERNLLRGRTNSCPVSRSKISSDVVDGYCTMGRGGGGGGACVCVGEVCACACEPTYESVAECVYATMRRSARRYPPPLPPRKPFGSGWRGSLGELPRRCSQLKSASQPAPAKKNNAFSVFRKRLKSDSRIQTSPKSETSKENKDVESKKKRFDFTPTRDIFKNFKVSRKIKNLKITNLNKGETKSCEFLDESEPVTTSRCSKSVECLETQEVTQDCDTNLSIDFNDDAVVDLALPQEIVDIILRGREQITKICMAKPDTESEYMAMSPIVPPPIDHYIAMSPKPNVV